MELNSNENIKRIISMFLLILLPLLLLVAIVSIDYAQPWYYYVSLVTWFGLGVMFYSAINK